MFKLKGLPFTFEDCADGGRQGADRLQVLVEQILAGREVTGARTDC